MVIIDSVICWIEYCMSIDLLFVTEVPTNLSQKPAVCILRLFFSNAGVCYTKLDGTTPQNTVVSRLISVNNLLYTNSEICVPLQNRRDMLC